MRNTKNFFTVIVFTSAALLLIALNGNASGNMTLNNQIPDQSACTTAKPDEGDTLGHSVPDTSLMREMSRPLDEYGPTEPLENNDALPEIKKDYFTRKYVKLKAGAAPTEPDGTGLRPESGGIAGRLPSGRMPEDPHILDPAGKGQEEQTAGPDLGGGAAGEDVETTYDMGNGFKMIVRENGDNIQIIQISSSGRVLWNSIYPSDPIVIPVDDPGQPAGGSSRGRAPHETSTEIELAKKFGGESPFAIDPETGRRKGRTWRPISPEDMARLDLIIDPGTGETRPKPKPNESVGPGATASDDDGEGTGGGFGPSGDTPGIGGPYGEGKGFGSRSKKENEPTARDAVIQPQAPHDGEGTVENRFESHEGESPFRKLPILQGDPSVGQ
ncbi:hypothetical protein ACFL2O_05930 [Thermodesulfobacteriota bacterium]